MRRLRKTSAGALLQYVFPPFSHVLPFEEGLTRPSEKNLLEEVFASLRAQLLTSRTPWRPLIADACFIFEGAGIEGQAVKAGNFISTPVPAHGQVGDGRGAGVA